MYDDLYIYNLRTRILIVRSGKAAFICLFEQMYLTGVDTVYVQRALISIKAIQEDKKFLSDNFLGISYTWIHLLWNRFNCMI